jgi:hypothetical protein
VSEAVDCALAQKDFRLAALIAQAASQSLDFKRHMRDQLEQWTRCIAPSSSGVTTSLSAHHGLDNSAFAAINSFRQHVYHILSGDIEAYAQSFLQLSLFISPISSDVQWCKPVGLEARLWALLLVRRGARLRGPGPVHLPSPLQDSVQEVCRKLYSSFMCSLNNVLY